MDPIRCPQCGGGIITREMWGWVNPATGKYVTRFIGFRFDTLFLSLFMFGMGILYAVFYLLAVPGYLQPQPGVGQWTDDGSLAGTTPFSSRSPRFYRVSVE